MLCSRSALPTFAHADGFNGKTIALSLENYYAEARRGRRGARRAVCRPAGAADAPRAAAQVTLTPADTVSFAPHAVHDAQEFPSLAALAGARRPVWRRARACATQPRGAAAPLRRPPPLRPRLARAERVQRNGVYGGLRLLYSLCAVVRSRARRTAPRRPPP